MTAIDIRHPHSLPLDQARAAIQQAAERLQERFGVRYTWQGDSLNFQQTGIDGRIDVSDRELHVTAKLGFLLAALKDTIEGEIRRTLSEKLDSPA